MTEAGNQDIKCIDTGAYIFSQDPLSPHSTSPLASLITETEPLDVF